MRLVVATAITFAYLTALVQQVKRELLAGGRTGASSQGS